MKRPKHKWKKKRYLPLQTRFPGWLVATRGGWPPRPHLPDTRTWQTRTFLSSLLNSALLYPLCSQVTREVGVDWRFGAHLLLRVQPIFGFTYYCISSSSVSSITLLLLIEEDEEAASMETARPILYNAWISSCSHRVRIALNLKGKLLLPLHTLESGWFLGLAEHLMQ